MVIISSPATARSLHISRNDTASPRSTAMDYAPSPDEFRRIDEFPKSGSLIPDCLSDEPKAAKSGTTNSKRMESHI